MTSLPISYGLWPSKIDASLVAGSSVRYSEPQFYQNHLFWSEGRPQEKGRNTIVSCDMDKLGSQLDVLPAPYSARSKVHEYGGGAYLVAYNHLFFVNASDQNLYKMALENVQAKPELVIEDSQSTFADLCVDESRGRLICVREHHDTTNGANTETQNSLIALSTDSSNGNQQNYIILASGHDFYANPCVSPDGNRLSFLTWDHPNMPWDNTQLWLAKFLDDGRLEEPVCIAGASGANKESVFLSQSIFQPQWYNAETLFYVSDKNNWWNLHSYCLTEKQSQPIHKIEAECATPQWTFNMSTYAFCDKAILVGYTQAGQWRLAQLNRSGSSSKPDSWKPTWLNTQSSTVSGLCSNKQNHFAFVGANASISQGIYLGQINKQVERLTPPPALGVAPENISTAQTLTIPLPTPDAVVHAFFYTPKHATVSAVAAEKPPCIVICHGGPTGATDTSLNWKIQFWTNRGFAVLDVNYRGSTGYGRTYRNALKNDWGIVDVKDLAQAASYLRAQGLVHPERIAIRGSSAGGFTVLACLTDTTEFNAGVSLYGVADLEVLATDTHKFECRYLDGLIGPYPEEKPAYVARSPIHKVNQIECPVALYQGLKDKVVPPNQATAMYRALKTQGLPVSLVEYAEEAHGFRQSDTIAHQLRSELAFYRQVFNLKSHENEAEFLTIDNF